MWKCKECGKEIKVAAILKESNTRGIYCECGKYCNAIGDLEEIAVWEE